LHDNKWLFGLLRKKKNAAFTWTDEHDVAFNKLKDAMTSEPICLSFPTGMKK